MILYNVTVNIDNSVEEEWLNWMKEKHIPDVMNTGCFKRNLMCKINAESEGGTSYSIQYFCESMKELDNYLENHAPKLQQEHATKYNGKFAAFRTLLDVIHTQEV